MRNKTLFFIFLLCSIAIFTVSARTHAQEAERQPQAIDVALAQKYFQEAERICKQDNGQLWGHTLCGPMIFFEPKTRMVVGNQSDLEGRLTRKGDAFLGRLPDEANPANTAITWAGVRWSMIFWTSLADDVYERDRLMIHESFHRIQDEIGLPMSNPSNKHLDSMQGRLWLQLEWRALRQALLHQGALRQRAATDALIFRLYRQTLFSQAASEERALEMNEGLAEYTGIKLSGRTKAELHTFLAGRLEKVNDRPSFIRSFAYESGPAYGLLLDEAKVKWRAHLKSKGDFGQLLQKALSLRLPENLEAEALKRSNAYGGDELRTAETKRENERLALMAAYRAKLVDGPVLILPLSDGLNYSFNPNNLIPLDSLGTIYPNVRIMDAWGIVEVTGGALMVLENNRPSRLYVPVPANTGERSLQGEGWRLQLNEGWKPEPAERKGDYILKKR